MASVTDLALAKRSRIPPEFLAKLREICLDLPEAYEESAWVGTRWCVRKKNFAHALMVDAKWPPAYAKAVQCDSPTYVVTFRLPQAREGAPRFTRPPFFRPVWFPNIAGMRLESSTDWDELDLLLKQSYCTLAPKKLSALVDHVDRP